MEKVLNELATLLKANDKAFEIVSQPEWKTEMLDGLAFVILDHTVIQRLLRSGITKEIMNLMAICHQQKPMKLFFGTEPEKQA